MICDDRLPRWVTTLTGDNKGNMKIAWDKRITVILSGLSYLHRLSRLSNSEIKVFLLEKCYRTFILGICIAEIKYVSCILYKYHKEDTNANLS